MSLKIEFDFYGERVNRELHDTTDRVVHAKPANEDVGMYVMGLVKKNVKSRGASGGVPWEPLAASTIAQKRREGSAHPTAPLRRTDWLFDSMTDRGHPDNVFVATDDNLHVGTRDRTLRWHQGSRRRGHVPRRAPYMFTAKQKRKMVSIIQVFTLKGRRNRG